jgi:hypothetical protein
VREKSRKLREIKISRIFFGNKNDQFFVEKIKKKHRLGQDVESFKNTSLKCNLE